jgi:hypothetical protein
MNRLAPVSSFFLYNFNGGLLQVTHLVLSVALIDSSSSTRPSSNLARKNQHTQRSFFLSCHLQQIILRNLSYISVFVIHFFTVTENTIYINHVIDFLNGIFHKRE